MAVNNQLKTFSPDELILSKEQTIIVLKFIFKPADHSHIDKINMNDSYRGFAQALLVEAIDASYAIGYVEGLFRATTNPTNGAVKIFKAFGTRAAKHWFKHARQSDLMNVKIYDFIRDQLARLFRADLFSAHASRSNNMPTRFISYLKPPNATKVWG